MLFLFVPLLELLPLLSSSVETSSTLLGGELSRERSSSDLKSEAGSVDLESDLVLEVVFLEDLGDGDLDLDLDLVLDLVLVDDLLGDLGDLDLYDREDLDLFLSDPLELLDPDSLSDTDLTVLFLLKVT